jgi:O-antigen ligase
MPSSPYKVTIKATTVFAYLAYLAAAILVLMPFHAFLTVWLSSGLGHYTALRLWKEVVLLILVVKVGWAYRHNIKKLRTADVLWRLIALYVALIFVSGLIEYALGGVNLKAFAYGLLIDTRFLVFFAVVYLISKKTDWLKAHWQQLLLIPAAVVLVFGLLQATVLPQDFLRHFGYGVNTIPVSATVDQKTAFERIGATLRGANPLGAYLVLIATAFLGLSLEAFLGAKRRKSRRSGLLLVGLVAALGVLAATYSRSGWIGTAVSLALLTWWSIRSKKAKTAYACAAAVLVIIGVISVFTLKNNSSFENTVFHTDKSSHSVQSSNAGHAAALKNGLKDIASYPLGSGTGTAGPASTYNNHPARIAENYYIQVGQETGVIGLVLFSAITIRVGQLLWRRRNETLSLILLASFVGLFAVNMLSHAWADDTLAYVWWGFAGMALSASLPNTAKAAKLNKKQT